jgi:eukaryotic translation initiation factor 2C
MTLDQGLPRRPDYGTAGKPITLRANYFDLCLKDKSQLLYRYDIQIEPSEGVGRKKVRRCLQLLLHQAVFKGVSAASDYASMLITDSKLPLTIDGRSFKITVYHEFETPFPAAVAGETRERRDARQRRTHTLRIRYSTAYAVAELYSYVNAEQHGASLTTKDDLVQALNIVFKRAANLQPTVSNLGQNKFYPFSHQMGTHPNTESMDLGHGLLALRGYFSSVRLAPQRVLVNLNVSCGAFYQPGALHTLMDAFMQNRDRSNESCLRELSAFIKGLKVCTRYTKERDSNGVEKSVLRVKSILGLATLPRLGANCLDIMFPWKNDSGSSVSSTVKEYFKQSLFPLISSC